MSPAPLRVEAGQLTSLTRRALVEAGMGGDHASAVSEIFVEGDLLGHSTHGVALLPRYLKELRDGRMTPDGEPGSVEGVYSPNPIVAGWPTEANLSSLTC